nr:uncharacterized protein LOC123571385 [Macaca fascicularis]
MAGGRGLATSRGGWVRARLPARGEDGPVRAAPPRPVRCLSGAITGLRAPRRTHKQRRCVSPTPPHPTPPPLNARNWLFFSFHHCLASGHLGAKRQRSHFGKGDRARAQEGGAEAPESPPPPTHTGYPACFPWLEEKQTPAFSSTERDTHRRGGEPSPGAWIVPGSARGAPGRRWRDAEGTRASRGRAILGQDELQVGGGARLDGGMSAGNKRERRPRRCGICSRTCEADAFPLGRPGVSESHPQEMQRRFLQTTGEPATQGVPTGPF